MAAIAQTDAEGRYTLENIPPGRYVIAAGRLDLQTYYPGTQALSDARVIAITAGAVVTDINFVMNSASFGRASEFPGARPLVNTAVVPVKVVVEGGGKLPLSANGRFAAIRFEVYATVLRVPIDSNSVSIPGGGSTDVQVVVEDLPEYYEVKSVTYGTTDVTRGMFKLTAANFAPPIGYVVTMPTPPSVSQPASQTPSALAALQTALQTYLSTLSVGTLGIAAQAAASPPSTVTVTISEKPLVRGFGSRVTGSLGAPGKRQIYISGKPGVVYSDGTFEFRGVAPGRHLIATANNLSLALAAMVVVGDADVNGVELKETFLLPDDIREPKDPLPAGNLPPGTTVVLPRIRGVVLDETTKEPIREGEVAIRSGDSSRTVPIDENGHFETFALLPGTYNLRLQIFAHSTIGPTLVIEDKDIELQVTSRRLY